MTDLPPDPPRLRAILAHLEQQIAENETVHTYLELQRDGVLQALDKAEGGEPQRAETPPLAARTSNPPAPQSRRRPSKPFKLGRSHTPDGPLPSSVHLADCHMAGALPHFVHAMEARLAITDANLEICQICRPDTLLDLDLD
ncbi:DUF6233 domain-containing protein [Streptomyces sp. NPDC006365]|uniref:DUF6233 domain-containing protein n=1 Tax=Streptomyces sp. NPDC006365 TaxID=3364744 RepID=UPI0036D17A44